MKGSAVFHSAHTILASKSVKCKHKICTCLEFSRYLEESALWSVLCHHHHYHKKPVWVVEDLRERQLSDRLLVHPLLALADQTQLPDHYDHEEDGSDDDNNDGDDVEDDDESDGGIANDDDSLPTLLNQPQLPDHDQNHDDDSNNDDDKDDDQSYDDNDDDVKNDENAT